MAGDQTEFQQFLGLSSVLTGFSVFQLQGTGQAQAYYATLIDIIGQQLVSEMMAAFQLAQSDAQDQAGMEKLLRATILSDEKLGPVARNLIKMWYVGTWYQLPQAWQDAFGVSGKDSTFVVSPAAYTEGLLWPTIGANPSGAKGPGYGTWGEPPQIS